MSLADDLAKASARKPRPRPCSTAVWLASQDEEVNTNFRHAVEDGAHMSELYRICVKGGLDVGLTQFKDHCQRRCCCARGAAVA